MMDLSKVEHILRAAGDATGHGTFVVIGTAAIFLWERDVPGAMAISREADLFAAGVDTAEVERISDELDAILGQASSFDETYGYYCDGVGEETAILPRDWRKRAKTYSSPATGGVTALVPHPDDLALAKLCAGREKDMAWLATGVEHGLITVGEMRSRLNELPAERVGGGLAALEARLTLLSGGGRYSR